MLTDFTGDRVPSVPSDGVIDPAFTALPLARVADAALDRCAALGVGHAEVRVLRLRERAVEVRDGEPVGGHELTDTGIAVRVLCDGAWGFAAGVELTPAGAVALADRAVEVARVCAPLNRDPVVLAPVPAYGERTWISPYRISPFDVTTAEVVAWLAGWCRGLLGHDGVDQVDASLRAVRENRFHADLAGTRLTQQRIRVHPVVTVVGVDPAGGGFASLRTTAPPAARGWEYLLGDGWDWTAELAGLPGLLTELRRAPTVEPGRYDLVLDPTHLWLTVHESIGHATELDRVLGYEAAYAGTSFATLDQLGTLRYGSPALTVTADRDQPYGLATVGWDDEGVAAGHWDLVRAGTLVGYQTDRHTAALSAVDGGRSTGCSYAARPGQVALLRMANVNVVPDPAGPSLAELIGRVERGLYLVGDRSYSIDHERRNFQFTGQRTHLIRDGRLVGQVRDAAYQSSTPEFWAALAAVGGPDTYQLGGAFGCGKGQPAQDAPVSHGTPAALFRGITVLNTAAGGGA